MNAERLNKILTELQREFSEHKLLQELQAVRDHLTNQVSNPQEPSYQQNLVTALKTLNEHLVDSNYNEFSPGWRQIVEEIGGKELFGNELKKQIDEIFNRNQITPAAALTDINVIVNKSTELKNAIDQIILGFNNLNIGREDLQPGQCEMGYSIPRLVVENKLNSLTKEVAELNFILGTISETVTGKKEDFEVKTISSSDFLFYVIISLQVANVLSNAIEKIINNYKTILEIKVLRNQLKEKGVPEKDTKGIEDHANASMEEVIKKIAKEVIEEYHKTDDAGRKNELENATVIALNKIANRIDKGFNIEIRVEALPEADEENKDNKEYQAKMSAIKNIQANSKSLEFINTSGQPILLLKEAEEKEKEKEKEKKK